MHDDGFFSLGPHLVRIDGNLVTLRARGVIMVEDMKMFFGVYERVRRENGSLFVLYDSRENTGLDPAARKYATDENADPKYRIDASAAFGATFTMRIVVNMMNRAYTALGKATARLKLCDTEAEARAYLEQERARLMSPIDGAAPAKQKISDPQTEAGAQR